MEKHFAVIGEPIEHSLSPWMHNAGYRAQGIEAEYQRFQVEAGRLAEGIKGLCALGFSGWNVTIPHKEAIIPYLDSLTPQAKRARAVNTVKYQEGQLIGHNTDGDGFIRSVENDLGGFAGKKGVLLGAGGAAKGVALALAGQGMELKILNRTPEKAADLAKLILEEGGKASWGEFAPGEWLESTDLLVQTTSIGLRRESFPFSLEGISKQTLVVDIIFNPLETLFLKEARKLGCRTQNGLDMLLYQGALAWEFWLGGQAPVEAMRKALRSRLLDGMFDKEG